MGPILTPPLPQLLLGQLLVFLPAIWVTLRSALLISHPHGYTLCLIGLQLPQWRGKCSLLLGTPEGTAQGVGTVPTEPQAPRNQLRVAHYLSSASP